MKAFDYLKDTLEELNRVKKSDEYYEFAMVNQKLIDKNVDIKVLGFKRFKDFIKAAEARELVEYKVENFIYYVKLKK